MPTNVIKETELRQHQVGLKKREQRLRAKLESEPENATSIGRTLDHLTVSLAWVEYLLGEEAEDARLYRDLLPPY